MKRLTGFLICLIFACMLTACGDDTVVLEKGDFSFPLPEGYALTEVRDKSCSILRLEDEATVGGFELTPLKVRLLKKDKKGEIMGYLQEQFHHTRDLEYITSHSGGPHPAVYATVVRWEDVEGKIRRNYRHIFFEKDHAVYHLWFDTDLIDYETTTQFTGLIG